MDSTFEVEGVRGQNLESIAADLVEMERPREGGKGGGKERESGKPETTPSTISSSRFPMFTEEDLMTRSRLCRYQLGMVPMSQVELPKMGLGAEEGRGGSSSSPKVVRRFLLSTVSISSFLSSLSSLSIQRARSRCPPRSSPQQSSPSSSRSLLST